MVALERNEPQPKIVGQVVEASMEGVRRRACSLGHLYKSSFSVMAASAACSNPHVFAHTLRFSTRGFLALTKMPGL